MLALYVTVAGIVEPAGFSSAKLIVLDVTGLLKVAVTADDKGMAVAPAAGVLPVATASAVAEGTVVNDQLYGAIMGSPAASKAPLSVAV